MRNSVLAVVGDRWVGCYLGREVARMGGCYLFDITNNIDFAKRFSDIESIGISSGMVNIGNEWVQVVPVRIKPIVDI